MTSLEILRLRASILASIRLFFSQREVMEVETPALSIAGNTDPNIVSMTSEYTGPGAPHSQTMYLHTSPEFPMKRLLASGSGPIYQLCKVFRQGESGRLHNPEFTLLEWYRPGFDYHELMDEVEDLFHALIGDRISLGASERISYREIFVRYAEIDPFIATVDELRQCVMDHGINLPVGLKKNDHDGWLDFILTHLVESHLGRGHLSFVYDYPVSQASLARRHPENAKLSQRFELYFEGLELANGFQELSDSHEQRQRFMTDLQKRATLGLDEIPVDERLLSALNHGLPECSGVAIGIDRLIMLVAGEKELAKVLAFPLARA
jgi:lysyl-tRNA synthetase class 2